MDKHYLSREKHEQLVAELHELKMVRRKEVAERLDFAKSLGDLSENAEYHAAREEQAEIEDRIRQLEDLLKSSEIVEAHHSTVVEVGTTLKVKRAGGSEQLLTIVGSEEADIASGKVSYQSPIGAALLGRKKGDSVTVETPRGSVEYKILSLE